MSATLPHQADVRSVDFEGVEIQYDDSVLAPRPWTAAQSRWTAELIRSAPPGPVLELCAGVGHIGLLAMRLALRRFVAVDASATACQFLKGNAAAAGIRVDIRHADLANALAADEEFAVIIADPPWVPSKEISQFPEDPRSAIDGGEDGLALVRLCLRVIDEHLCAGGSAVLQVGPEGQVDRVAELLTDHPRLRLVEVRTFERGSLIQIDAGTDEPAT